MTLIESIYGRICQHLRARREHVARVISGAACEQWFSAEAYAAVNWAESPVLPPGHSVAAESRKRDLVVLDLLQYVVGWIECKVIYNNKNMEQHVAELAAQTRRDLLGDERADCLRAALVYIVWGDYLRRREWREEADYLAAVSRTIAAHFPEASGGADAERAFDPIVASVEMLWPTGTYRVSLHTRLIVCRDQHSGGR